MNSNIIDLAAYRAKRIRAKAVSTAPGYFVRQNRDGSVVCGLSYPHEDVCLYSGASLTKAIDVMQAAMA